MLELALLGAFGIGIAVGNQITYWLSTRPQIDRLSRMRYDGFRPETPMPERPKTVPFPSVNES